MSHRNLCTSLLLCCFLLVACSLSAQDAAVSRTLWQGRSGKYTVDWSTANLTVTRAEDGKTIVDAAAEAKAEWASLLQDSNGEPMEAQLTYRLLSVVGPYLSWEESEYCDCGGAHPTEVKQFRTIDLDKTSSGPPTAASLTDIFPEGAVLKALIADPIVAKALAAGPKPDSLVKLLRVLPEKEITVGECAYEFSRDGLSRFALYDTQGGNALVRLGLTASVEVCRGQLTQLGLALPIPESDRSWFLGAKNQHDGLLMVASPRKERSAVTAFHFSQKAGVKQ